MTRETGDVAGAQHLGFASSFLSLLLPVEGFFLVLVLRFLEFWGETACWRCSLTVTAILCSEWTCKQTENFPCSRIISQPSSIF